MIPLAALSYHRMEHIVITKVSLGSHDEVLYTSSAWQSERDRQFWMGPMRWGSGMSVPVDGKYLSRRHLGTPPQPSPFVQVSDGEPAFSCASTIANADSMSSAI